MLYGSAALVMLSGTPAYGQAVQTDPPRRVQVPATDPAAADIVVTARRIAEREQTVPIAISVRTARDIDRQAINTPQDLNKIPGLSGAPIGSLTNISFAIRGQGAAFGGQQGVIPYFAEVPNYPSSSYDLQSIQVLKGPQGTLFGQNATGGVVLFEPARPVNELSASAQLDLGNHDYRQLRGVLNAPLIGNSLLARLSFQVRRRDGWGHGIYPDGRPSVRLNNLDNVSARLSIAWRPTDRFENVLILTSDRAENDGNLSPLYLIDTRFMNPAARNLIPANVPAIAAAYHYWTGRSPPAGKSFAELLADAFARQLAAGPLTMYTDYGLNNRALTAGLIDQTTWQLTPALRLRNIVGLRVGKTRGATYDQDATDLPLLDFQCRFVPGTMVSTGQCADVGGWPDRTLTEELQLQGHALSNRLQFQFGAFASRAGIRRFREDTRPFVVFGRLSGDPASASFCTSVNVASPCASLSRSSVRSNALFGQATFAVLPRVRLTAGYRRTWDRAVTETTGKPSYRVPFDGAPIAVPVYGDEPAPGALILTTVVRQPSKGTYNLSADWQVSDHLLLYLAHRSGYKSGGINAVANPGTPLRTYGPERSRDVEAGAKLDWRAGRLSGRLNLAAYQTWYGDIQEGEIIPGTAQTITTNLANARIRGLEVETATQIADWLSIDADLAYTDARYTEWLERSSCSAQFWRPQCAALPGSTEIVIDHAGGQLSIAGQTISFHPDRFANSSKWQWSLRPTLHLQPLVGEKIDLSANVYGRTAYVDATAVANSSKLAGLPAQPQTTVLGYTTSDPFTARGYGLVDLRADWTQAGGSRVSLAAGITNLANKKYRVSSASALEIIGAVYTLLGEPRMIYGSVRIDF